MSKPLEFRTTTINSIETFDVMKNSETYIFHTKQFSSKLGIYCYATNIELWEMEDDMIKNAMSADNYLTDSSDRIKLIFLISQFH